MGAAPESSRGEDDRSPMTPAPRTKKKRVLVVGGGSREHALAWALREHELLFAPGNGGTAALGRNVPVSAADVGALVDVATKEAIDLVVVGPEQPLTLGLVDALAT